MFPIPMILPVNMGGGGPKNPPPGWYVIVAFVVFIISLILFKFVFSDSFCYTGLFGGCSLIDYLLMVIASLAIAIGWPVTIPVAIIVWLMSL